MNAADRLGRIEYLQAEGTASEQLLEQIDYRYDARGLRTARTTLNGHGSGTAETPMQATYDAANRMLTLTLGSGSPSTTYALTYDAEGNLTAKQNTANPSDKTLYTWDAQNQLVQIVQTGPQGSGTGTVTASFTYDSFGRRVQSSIQLGTNPAQTVQYVYEGAQALGEIRSGQLSHRLMAGLGLDETIARVALASSGSGGGSGGVDAAKSRHFLTDALNSVIAQHNAASTGGLANSYAYSPYGQSTTVGPDDTNNPIKYTSGENDQTGLLFYRARYYDPVMKRFISSDPIGLAGGMNTFAYVEGDPVSLVDPDGLRGLRPQQNPYGSPYGRPQYVPSSREVVRNRELLQLPAQPTTVSMNSDTRLNFELLKESFGNLDFRTPSNLNWGNSFPGPVPLGCTLIRVFDKPGQCSANSGLSMVCGHVVGPPR